MEKQIEIMKQTKELLQTVHEGLEHIQQLIKDGQFEVSVNLFNDSVQAYSMIETAIIGLPGEMLSEDARNLTDKVRKAMELVVTAYETKSYGEVQEILQFTLLPSFKKWQEGLEKSFEGYLVN